MISSNLAVKARSWESNCPQAELGEAVCCEVSSVRCRVSLLLGLVWLIDWRLSWVKGVGCMGVGVGEARRVGRSLSVLRVR